MPRRRDSITPQFQIIKRALAKLETSIAELQKLAQVARRTKSDAPRPRAITLTPARRNQLKLHGAYIGHLRHLKPRQKAQVKAVKAKKGYEAAIRMAKRIAGGRQ